MASAVSFTASSIGKKYVMAVSGVVLFGFTIVHMAGNLQLFLGRERFNGYAATLHSMPGVLWVFRGIMILAVLAHFVTSLQLVMRNRAARPHGYGRKANIATTYAARTMAISGPIILFYVIYHLLHFTLNVVHPGYDPTDIYSNVVASFRQVPIAASYIVANALFGFHVFHGAYSLFQSLGVNHPRYNGPLRTLAMVIAVVVATGFIAVPVGVLAGLTK